MAASWLEDVLGPSPAPRVVSMTSKPGAGGGMYGPPTPPAPTANGSATSGFDINALLAKLQGSWDESNNAGMAQYQNLLSAVGGTGQKILGSGGLYDQAQNLMANAGQSGQQGIRDNTTQALAESEQDLTSRGLGNTTIRSAARRGIRSDAAKQTQSLNEGVNGMKAGLLTQRAGAEAQQGSLLADSILSKQNVGPDANFYAQLIAQLAANGGLGANPTQGATGSSVAPTGGGSYGGGGGGSYGGGGGGGGSGFGGGGSGSGGNSGVQHFTNPGGTAAPVNLPKRQFGLNWNGHAYFGFPGADAANAALQTTAAKSKGVY